MTRRWLMILSVLVLASALSWAFAASNGDERKAPAPGGACAPKNGAPSAPTRQFGKKGARVEVIAVLPVTHGCHVRTEAALKTAQQQHPKDVHLTVVDLFGPDAPKYLAKVGGGPRAVVSVNGRTSFDLGKRKVRLERMEGDTYSPSDLGPIIDQELKRR